ncbi:glycoside hydrolase family 31 protein [Segetibacter koreensis]|uniref:glycoside hydrolase family 31 protein n=1 Tax=Segetibacter koreensis TaxID=398037 RepID=UPI00037C712D|nr:glycoside hydrolase family 31 protein [Segetibacter koreensis]
MIKNFTFCFLLCCCAFIKTFSQSNAVSTNVAIKLQPGERWWGGAVSEADKGPFGAFPYGVNLIGDNKGNQAQPLLISNHGRYVWCNQPFAFSFLHDSLLIDQACDSMQQGKAGNTLGEVYRYVSQNYFPATGKHPDTLLFTQPQWNTWIELTYNQNQQDILKYAQSIIENGFKPGVLMIDDTWQEDYGIWNFHPGRFPDPKGMMNKLHQMGFKVMLWICPFISADAPPYRTLKSQKALLLESGGDTTMTWQKAKTEPAIIRWWNGASAVLDFTNPVAVKWFKDQLNYLQKTYGVDGFKFDAGDSYFYPSNTISFEKTLPNHHTELFGQIGLAYPLNEYRAMWKMGGQPLAERIADKNHNWEDLQKLIPQVAVQGLEGYSFTCPDMIGGGDYVSFLNRTTLDQDLIVRSAQCHALMPMMQFSVAPWRVLDEVHLAAIKKAVSLRQQKTGIIMQLVLQAAHTGEPIMRPLEYVFPMQGYADVKDQFMLGNNIMVAPMLVKGKTSREVLVPKGKWKADDGQIIKGPSKVVIQVPLDRLPYFERLK